MEKNCQKLLNRIDKGNADEKMLCEALLFRNHNQQKLFARARKVRDKHFKKNYVEVRSVIEISNVCKRKCLFCNLSKESSFKRYTLSENEIREQVDSLVDVGRKTFLLQSGELGSSKFLKLMCSCCEYIKKKCPDARIILCLGNLSPDQYQALYDAGAERYIIKFETSNPELYRTIKPDDTLEQRLECLEKIIDIGFDAGTGNIVGLPGQALEDIAKDLLMMKEYNLSMVSSTVFIPGEKSKFAGKKTGNLNITLNMMALLRIMNPKCLIPSTSSLEKVEAGGQYHGLMAGANSVTVHDGTPPPLKELFPIYSTDRFTPPRDHCYDIIEKANLIPSQYLM